MASVIENDDVSGGERWRQWWRTMTSVMKNDGVSGGERWRQWWTMTTPVMDNDDVSDGERWRQWWRWISIPFAHQNGSRTRKPLCSLSSVLFCILLQNYCLFARHYIYLIFNVILSMIMLSVSTVKIRFYLNLHTRALSRTLTFDLPDFVIFEIGVRNVVFAVSEKFVLLPFKFVYVFSHTDDKSNVICNATSNPTAPHRCTVLGDIGKQYILVFDLSLLLFLALPTWDNVPFGRQRATFLAIVCN